MGDPAWAGQVGDVRDHPAGFGVIVLWAALDNEIRFRDLRAREALSRSADSLSFPWKRNFSCRSCSNSQEINSRKLFIARLFWIGLVLHARQHLTSCELFGTLGKGNPVQF